MKKTAIIFLVLLMAAAASATVVRSNLDPRVDQDLRTTASPTFVDLILTGGNIKSANSINIKPSDDNDDYLSFSTVGDVPRATIIGGNEFSLYTDTPVTIFGIRESDGNGIVLTWAGAFDAGSIIANGTLTFGSSDVFRVQPSGDGTDFFEFSTVANIPTMVAIGGSVIDFPGMDFTGIGGIDMSGILSFATNTIADGQFTGDWVSLGSVDGGVDPGAVTDVTGGALEAHYKFEDDSGSGNLVDTANAHNLVEDSANDTAHIDRGMRVQNDIPIASKGLQGDGINTWTVDDAWKGVTGTGARSVSVWFKNTAATQQNIINWGDSAGGVQDWQFTYSGNTGKLGVLTGEGNRETADVSATLNDGNWHLLTCTVGASETFADILLYIDAVEVSATSVNGGTSVNTSAVSDVEVGHVNGAQELQCGIDELAVFSKQLSQAEIDNIFARQGVTYVGGSSNGSTDWANASTAFSTDKSGRFGGNLTMEGALFTLGDGSDTSADGGTPIVINFDGLAADGTLTYTESEEDLEVSAFIFETFFFAQGGFRAISNDGGDISSFLNAEAGNITARRTDDNLGGDQTFSFGPAGIDFRTDISGAAGDINFDAMRDVNLDGDRGVKIQTNTLAPTEVGGTLSAKGFILQTTRVTSSPYAVLANDDEIFVDTDSADITVNLLPGVDGKRLRIINAGTSGNDVTMVPNGAELLDGENASKSFGRGELILTYEPTEGWI